MLSNDAIKRLALIVKKESSATVTDRLYGGLRSMILRRELQAGTVIEERRLAEMLSTSRTPMRGAMDRLLGEELLTRLSNGALVVRSYTLQEYFEFVRVRKILEAESAALAAAEIPQAEIDLLRSRVNELAGVEDAERYKVVDDMFHETIAAHSQNSYLMKLIRESRNQAQMCSVGKVRSRSEETCAEHLVILDALATRDGQKARSAMLAHLDNVERAFMRTMQIEPARPHPVLSSR